VIWDGLDDRGTAAPPGGYVVLLVTSEANGQPRRRCKQLAVVGTARGHP
jgi:hypothetical protein